MQQIIAIGGGGYYSPAEVALNKYVADQCPAAQPKVCLLGQAGGEHPHWTQVFTDSFSALGCEGNHLSLFFPHTRDIEDFLRSQDVIFVGGGNTKSMLALWREWGIDQILRQAWQDGVVLAGVSAGAICWFDEGVTDSIPGELSGLPGLGLIPGSCCPHYVEDPERRPAYHAMIGRGLLEAGYAIDDLAAVHFQGTEPLAVVSARPDAGAYKVSLVDDTIVESRLDVEHRDISPQ
jgi:dipeptidase E